MEWESFGFCRNSGFWGSSGQGPRGRVRGRGRGRVRGRVPGDPRDIAGNAEEEDWKQVNSKKLLTIDICLIKFFQNSRHHQPQPIWFLIISRYVCFTFICAISKYAGGYQLKKNSIEILWCLILLPLSLTVPFDITSSFSWSESLYTVRHLF